MSVIIKKGALPPQHKKKNSMSDKYRYFYSLDFGEYAELGKLNKRQYGTLANRVWLFNKENGRKLGIRTTANGVVIYRKV
tara:strand:+ start:1406 stop:1645 length:240 start_codon:yes stop_codon:yes gene_type:complete